MKEGNKLAKSIVAVNAKRIITELGYKQKTIAQKAGYNEKTFSNLLNGRKIMTDCDIVAISEALGITPNDLFAVQQNTA